MPAEKDRVISVLNDLIEIGRDAEEGFKKAADAVKDNHLRSTFLDLSQQRAQFVTQLQAQVESAGGAPGAPLAHRGWIGLKAAVTGGDESAIVSECERGEDQAVSSYRKALNEDLPPEIRTLVEAQATQVQHAHDRIRALEVKLEK
ncbi:MAG: ferritin-like domain-containing protein [Bryobacteraceae bacterium]